MKNRGRKITITILLMIILWICAFFLHDVFFEMILRQFRDINVRLVSTELLSNSYPAFTFASVISILPPLFLFSHFVLKDQKPSIFLFIVPIALLCGIAMMSLHIYSLKMEITEMNETLPHFIQNAISVSDIHAARHLGIGFILGTVFTTGIISFVSRDRKS